MNEDIVSFETAKVAKEKGFNWSCVKHYDKNGSIFMDDMSNDENDHDEYAAPTQALLQKWLREEHRINVESNYLPNIDQYKCLFIPMDLPKPKTFDSISEGLNSRKKYLGKNKYYIYEDALEDGLYQALILIK